MDLTSGQQKKRVWLFFYFITYLKFEECLISKFLFKSRQIVKVVFIILVPNTYLYFSVSYLEIRCTYSLKMMIAWTQFESRIIVNG